MKKLVFICCMALAFVACTKLDDQIEDRITTISKSAAEADVTVDGETKHIAPNFGTPFRADDFFTINVSTKENYPSISIWGSFPTEGVYTSSDSTDVFFACRKAKGGDEELFNTDYNENDEGMTVIITKRDGNKIEGTFHGYVHNENGKKCIVENGFFSGEATF